MTMMIKLLSFLVAAAAALPLAAAGNTHLRAAAKVVDGPANNDEPAVSSSIEFLRRLKTLHEEDDTQEQLVEKDSLHGRELSFKRSFNTKRRNIPPNCEWRKTKKPIPCPPSPPPKLPRKCSGFSASWSGDPHFRTFDKLKYDCQGEGVFDIVQSVKDYETMEPTGFSLQGQFVKFIKDRKPTVTKSVALNTGDGQPTIQVTVPDDADNGCMPDFFLSGDKKSMKKHQVMEGMEIKQTKSKKEWGYVIFYQKTEIQLKVAAKKSKRNGCVLRAEICIPDCYKRLMDGEKFVGLLGTPNGDKEDDWRTKTGGTATIKPKNYKEELEWCTKNWCVADSKDNLLTFEDGSTFDSVQAECSDQEPDKTIEDCIDTPGAELMKVCGENNVPCYVDGCVDGPRAAKQYVEGSLNQVDKNCGTEIYSQNFDEPLNDDTLAVLDKAKGDVDDPDAVKVTKYLELSKSSPTFKFDFEVDDGVAMVSVEFLFFEIGTWDASGGLKDWVYVTVGGVEIDLLSFSSSQDDGDKDGVVGGMYFSRSSITKRGDLGFANGGKTDQIHKVLIKIPPLYFAEEGNLEVSLFAKVTGNDEKGGIDEIQVLSFKEKCKIDCDGTSVVKEDFDADDESDWGIEPSTLQGGHTVLGPIEEGGYASKTFDVSSYADSADIKFALYLSDFTAWEDSGNRFDVTISGTKFDLDAFEDEEIGLETDGYTGCEVKNEDDCIIWARKAKSLTPDLGVYTVILKVSDDFILDGSITVGFSVTGDAKASVDDFSIMVYPAKEKCEPVQAAADAAKDDKNKSKCPSNGNGGSSSPGTGGSNNPEICWENVRWLECSPTPAPSPMPVPDVPTPEPPSPVPPTPEPPSPRHPTPGPPPTPEPPSPESPSPRPPSPSPDDDVVRTPAPTKKKSGLPTPGIITGEPHIKRWSGDSYDFHGECELVMLSNPDFNNGQGLHIHIRTKIQRWWSYVETAAVKIGNDIFEVQSGIQTRRYWVNGREGHRFLTSRNLDFKIGGFAGRFRAKNNHVIQYKFYLTHGQTLMIRSVKEMLRVELDYTDPDDFGNGVGLMGSYGNGDLVGRNGTVFAEDDTDAFGFEWQVRPHSDPSLFHSAEGPQYPVQCNMPTVEQTARRLASTISLEDARAACSHAEADEFKNCVVDVRATDDVEAAEGYF